MNKNGKFYVRGNQGLSTQQMNDTQTGYVGELKKWTGLVEIEVTPVQNKTVLAADNNPNWDTIKGTLTATVVVRLFGIAQKDWQHLFNVETSDETGVSFGGRGDTINFGLTVDKICNDSSLNKLVIFKLNADLPAMTSTTVTIDDVAVEVIEIPMSAYPVFFPISNGDQDERTYRIINNKENAEFFAANTTAIVYPTESITPAPTGEATQATSTLPTGE